MKAHATRLTVDKRLPSALGTGGSVLELPDERSAAIRSLRAAPPVV